MAASINSNIAALNTTQTLNSHYGRLATSVQRLSSGLRINSAADDAAGLAIRELMRSDVAALNQGMRNASDAISMLQVADGALAIIDEKLIRMKELAEQAATGTYSSTQRLMIASEYKAMAAEIDRIANATDFNGIKLLNGSLSGQHNGSGLTSTGAMKIHFGAGNDSAEDYYYVEIGACTSKALGLGSEGTTITTTTIENVRVENLIDSQKTWRPKDSYIIYTDPDTNKQYYFDGDFFFSDPANPGGSMLNWETDGELIKKIKPQQETKQTQLYYSVYIDPDTNIEYYRNMTGKAINKDPYDPQSLLDPGNAADAAILNRLQISAKSITIQMIWKVYENANGDMYYTYNNGDTFVPDPYQPVTGIIDSKNPAHQGAIKSLTPHMTEKKINFQLEVNWLEYTDSQTGRSYWSKDGGQTFYNHYNGYGTALNPDNANDAVILQRLVPTVQILGLPETYDVWVHKDTGERYYTKDKGKTFITDVSKPDNISVDSANPAHAATFAKLEPTIHKSTASIKCQVYEDIANGNKKYYSYNDGRTFFDDMADYSGSTLDTTDANYNNLISNFQKVDSTVFIAVIYNQYRDPNSSTYYYSLDGVNFLKNGSQPESLLDPTNPAEAAIITRLQPVCDWRSVYTAYQVYSDANGNRYYTTDGNIFRNSSGSVILDRSNPAHVSIIDGFQIVQKQETTYVYQSFPDIYYIYQDGQSGTLYYRPDNEQTFTPDPTNPDIKDLYLDPNDPSDKAIIDNLTPVMTKSVEVSYIQQTVTRQENVPGSASISTQEQAQRALVSIDRAIVSKDKIRAHLGALQNRLENTVANLSIQAENLQTAESRISDADIALEMTEFVRNQVLTQSAIAMLGQANSYPHMLMALLK